jgi:urease accessory protein
MTLLAARDVDATPGGGVLPRSFGALDLEFVARAGRTHALRTYQQGVLRVRFPHVPRDTPPEAVLINTAGGLTGGDSVTMTVTLRAQAQATITSQAHEKIYRASQGAAAIAARIAIENGASLEWLPQPTILFDRAGLARRTEVSLAGDARLLAVEAVIFGRTAMAEAVRQGALDDDWRIRRDGRLIHADRFALDGDIAAGLAGPAVLGGGAAMATLRLVAPDAEARLEEARALLGDDGGASAWNGLLLARIVARDGRHLGAVLARLLTGLRGRPLPPIWTI